MCKPRTLHLVLTQYWYSKIESGEKTSEYRACSEYWNKRFCGGKPVLLPDNTVECMTTDCPMHPDYIMPIEKWNTRK